MNRLILLLIFYNFKPISCDFNDPESCCKLETLLLTQSYDEYYTWKEIRSRNAIKAFGNQDDSIIGFSSMEDSFINFREWKNNFNEWKENQTEFEYEANFTVLLNPLGCSLVWKTMNYNSQINDDSRFLYVKKSHFSDVHSNYSNTLFGKKENLYAVGLIQQETKSKLYFRNEPMNYIEALVIDCKDSAEKHIKQVSTTFEKPAIDFNMIQKKYSKQITFFYSSVFENDSPESYSESFDYTESKDISVTISSTEIDQLSSTNSWASTQVKQCNWYAEAGFSFWGASARAGSGGSNTQTNEQSGSRSHSYTTTSQRENTITKSIRTTKTGSINVEPYSRAKVVGIHYDIKNAIIENTIMIKLGSNIEGYSSSQIKKVVERTKIAGKIPIIMMNDFTYMKLNVKLKIDMGTDNEISITGSAIFDSESLQNYTKYEKSEQELNESTERKTNYSGYSIQSTSENHDFD